MSGRKGSRASGAMKGTRRALGVKFRVTDVLNPQGALKREAQKLVSRAMRPAPDVQRAQNDGNRNQENLVQVSSNTRSQFGAVPTDELLRRLQGLLKNAPELEVDDRSGGIFDEVQEWFSDRTPQDAAAAARTFKGMAREGRRAELNAIFEHTVRTMTAAEESIQTRHPRTRSRLQRARGWLRKLGWDAATLQARVAGEVITILSERIGKAYEVVGKGAGAGLEALMGGTPRELFGDWSLLVVAVSLLGITGLVAGGYVMTTPGGMFAVSTAAKATGGAVSSGAKLAKLVL